MTIQMIITLAIVIGMIVMIMSDKFAFGAPPLIACVLLVPVSYTHLAPSRDRAKSPVL